MAFPLLPAALGGTSLALFLLTGSKKNVVVNPDRPLPPPIPNPGRKTRPDPNQYPPGSGDAITKPNAQNGMLIRTTPDSQPGEGPGGANGKTNLAAPEGDLHLRPGDHLVVLRTGVAAEDNRGGQWWEVIAPSGTRGYTRAIDPAGVENFTLVRAPSNAPVAGIAGEPKVGAWSSPRSPRAFGMAYASPRRRARVGEAVQLSAENICQAPIGCWIRRAPNPQAEGVALVPPNGTVIVDDVLPCQKYEATSPGPGGWAKVRYFAPGSGVAQEGFVLAEWFAPKATAPEAPNANVMNPVVGAWFNPMFNSSFRSPLRTPPGNPQAAQRQAAQNYLAMRRLQQQLRGGARAQATQR